MRHGAGSGLLAEKAIVADAQALNAASLKHQADVLTLAATLELDATNASRA